MKIKNYIEYKRPIKAKRIIYNKSANDFNNEPEYKLQKVLIWGETITHESYVLTNQGTKKYIRHKSQVFLDRLDLENKIDDIKGFDLTEHEKEYLLEII